MLELVVLVGRVETTRRRVRVIDVLPRGEAYAAHVRAALAPFARPEAG